MPPAATETKQYASPVLADALNPYPTVPDVPDYSEDEIAYLGGLQTKLTETRNVRESQHDEFDGMPYSTWWEANEKSGQTFIEPRKNAEDSNFQSGTVRRKIFAFIGELLKINFHADVTAYDQNDLECRALGNGVEDAIAKSEEMDGDEEKRGVRFYELLKQGDVFVETVFDEHYVKEKKFKGAKFDGKIEGVTWTTKLKRKFSRASRKPICGLNVYLGNIRQYDFGKQPFIFTVDIIDYAEAESIYGKWERWPFVSKTLKEFSPNRERAMRYNNWRLLDFQKGKVERIRYQDKFGNEFALILNGVLMTPVGLPLPWGYDDYNIVQQHLKPLSAYFAYGSSMRKEIGTSAELRDAFFRIGYLRELQKLMPARFNLTGRTVSRRVFLPAAITAGLDPRQLPMADDRAIQGMTESEFKMLQLLQDEIDKNSIGPIPSGEQPQGDPTATEVLEVSRQAKTIMQNVLIACTLLEWKLAWVSLFTILAKWFDPVGDKVNAAREGLINKYRSYGVAMPIADKGMGRRVTVLTDEKLPSSTEVKELEEFLERRDGTPYRFNFLKPSQVTDARWVWAITERPKPKANDELSKIMFNKMVADAISLFGPDVNLPELEGEYAVMWDRDPKKFFRQGQRPVLPAQPGAPVAKSVSLPRQPQPVRPLETATA